MTEPRLVLGRVQGRTLFPQKETLTDQQMNHHVHVVGPSGYGKTVLLTHVIKHQIQTGKGLLFMDLKADMETILHFSRIAADAGRANDLQIFSISNPELSWKYNPFQGDTANQLRDKIMAALDWSEPYYKHQSASFLLKLLIGLKRLSSQDEIKCTPLQVRECSTRGDEIAKCIRKLAKEEIHEARCLEEAYQFISTPEGQKSLSGLRTQLESLVLSDFGNLISGEGENQIDLFKSARDSKITLIFLDSRRYPSTAKTMAKFLLQDLKAASAKIDAEIPKEQRKPFAVIIDEFADIANEDFVGFLDRARSSKMMLTIAHQEFSDLKRVSPEFAARVMANTSTLYAFMQKLPESAELVSRMSGTKTVWKETVQSQGMGFFDLRTGNKSLREVEEFAVHPNVVKSLKVGECLSIKKYPRTKVNLVKVDRE